MNISSINILTNIIRDILINKYPPITNSAKIILLYVYSLTAFTRIIGKLNGTHSNL